MATMVESFLDGVDTFLAWLSTSLKQTTESYCELETADSRYTLVAHDGSLVSVLKIYGVTALVGAPEFRRLREGIALSLHTAMSQPGHAVQVYFSLDQERVPALIKDIYEPAHQTAKRLSLDLDDLFSERINFLSQYCAEEHVYFVFWTYPTSLSAEQLKTVMKEKMNTIKEHKIPPFKVGQNPLAAIADLRDSHDAFVRSVVNDLNSLTLHTELLEVHDAITAIRMSADPEFTDQNWRATLPGDKLPIREVNGFRGEISDVFWPSLAKQILPRDAEIQDLRTVRMGDRIFSNVYIDLFPKDIKPFIVLLQRTLAARIPWRISFFIESEGLAILRFKGMLSTILSFSSAENRLISDATNLLRYLDVNTDDRVVRFRVVATTWAKVNEETLLRTRASELAKAIEGWGTCEVSEVSGDPFAGVISSMVGVTSKSVAVPAAAPLSDVIYMLPITRPASQWSHGALLFRSPDGKPWPYQPGSREQTTWIDLIYARPGSGKSVLSNALNLSLCLSAGLNRLPRIAIVDIGPSSSGLISLLKEALPPDQRHLVAYHRLRMTREYSINPFDTQLGCRYPVPSERAFLVNFLTLLATPLGATRSYDGIPDLAGMVVDALYKELADENKPHNYVAGMEILIDGLLEEIGFVGDAKTTWWEVTDALFVAGFVREARMAQRYAAPLLADAASVCRQPAIDDLYGKIKAPTGESLIEAFARMISAAVREFPNLAQVTQFEVEANIVAANLEEVAPRGGDAANHQTEVMYMITRHALARHYYLTEDVLTDIPAQYHDYHRTRISEIREDPKRLVYDEFHRTSKSQAVRDQVILDMREGRKWKVQVALLSQSLDDFDKVMVDFATSVYIMEAGPAQAVEKTVETFGLSETAKIALRTRVHGPREGGATLLAQFATKNGINTQLLTLTLGPIELWAFSTTAEDANLRNKLYRYLGPAEARRVLATLFPTGTAMKEIEHRLAVMREEVGLIEEDMKLGIVDRVVKEILDAYSENPYVQALPHS